MNVFWCLLFELVDFYILFWYGCCCLYPLKCFFILKVTQQRVMVGIGIKTSIEIDMMLKNMLDIQILLSILFESILFY